MREAFKVDIFSAIHFTLHVTIWPIDGIVSSCLDHGDY